MKTRKYEIDINLVVDTATQGNTVETTLKNGTPKSAKKSQTETNDNEKSGNAALLMVAQYAKIGVTKTISNWGDMTGNYLSASTMQAVYNLVDTGITAALNLKVGLAKLAVDTAISGFDYIKSRNQSQRVANWNMYRANYGKRE